MSESEFEQYLRLLGGVLRLDSRQRQEIAAELRDHLEQRLVELTEQGMARDEAILLALEEFGDVAGLAGEFAQIFRQRNRRRVMKVTAFSVGGLAAAFVLMMAMFPQDARVPLARSTVAQAPKENPKDVAPAAERHVKTSNSTSNVDESVSKNNAKTEALLAKRLSADFDAMPLKDVISYICDSLQIQCYLDEKSLEQEGTGVDAPVTVFLKEVRADMLLDLCLAQVGESCVYVVRDGIVVISSNSNLEGISEVRVYDCRDLLRMASFDGAATDVAPAVGGGPFPPYHGPMPPPGSGAQHVPSAAVPTEVLAQFGSGGAMGGMGGGAGTGFVAMTPYERRVYQLINIITTCIQPETWMEKGGVGTVSEFNGLLVINHNVRVHQQVDRVLNMIREVAKNEMPLPAPVGD